VTATVTGQGTADELLDDADRLLSGERRASGAWWPRATAFLLRSALELELAAYWAQVEPGLQACSMRAQLTVLRRPEYAGPDTGTDVAAAWHALSRASHHHAYELAPTVAELRSWAGTVRDATAVLRRIPTG
jgi:hypothetical protein